MGSSLAYAAANAENYIEAWTDDPNALMDLGMIYSSGAGGTIVDLIEAHKWFNLASLKGCRAAQALRSEVAEQMSPQEIAAAQKAARAYLAAELHA
jgi:uncharacterized protein